MGLAPERSVATSPRLDEEHTFEGGAEPTREPHSQDTAGGGRSIGLSLTTIVGAALIAVPVIWAGYYLMQVGSAGLGGGFVVLVGIVMLVCLGTGVMLLRGLLKT